MTITVIVHIHVPTETYYVTKTVDNVLVQSNYADGLQVEDVRVHLHSFFNLKKIKALIHCRRNSNISVSNLCEKIQSLCTNNSSYEIVALLIEFACVFNCHLRLL